MRLEELMDLIRTKVDWEVYVLAHLKWDKPFYVPPVFRVSFPGYQVSISGEFKLTNRGVCPEEITSIRISSPNREIHLLPSRDAKKEVNDRLGWWICHPVVTSKFELLTG